MISFDASAVRGIVTAVALLVGLSAPPTMVSHVSSLLSNDCISVSGADLDSELQLLSLKDGSDFTLSLEWALFNPKHGFCATNIADSVEESLVVDSIPHCTMVDHSEVCTNSSLDLDYSLDCKLESSTANDLNSSFDWSGAFVQPLTDIDLNSTFDCPAVVYSVTASFEPFTALSGLTAELKLKTLLPELESSFESLTGLKSGLLSSLEQLRLYLRGLILSVLPTQWTDWITHNRLTAGLICVSVMYGSLLCPVLFLLWTLTRANKRLTKELKIVNGTKLTVESQLSVLTWERDALFEKLTQANTLSNSRLQDTVNSYTEKLQATNEDNVQLKTELSEVSNDLEAKLLNTKRELEQYQLSAFEAQEKLALAEEQLERQKKESMETKELICSVIDSFTKRLQENKQKSEQALLNMRATVESLGLSSEENETESEKRECGIDAMDSGVCELEQSLSDDLLSDSSVLISMFDH